MPRSTLSLYSKSIMISLEISVCYLLLIENGKLQWLCFVTGYVLTLSAVRNVLFALRCIQMRNVIETGHAQRLGVKVTMGYGSVLDL